MQNQKLRKLVRNIINECLNESNESFEQVGAEIVKFVKENSYFDFEGVEDGVLQFSTRENGSISSETASNIDILEGKKIKNELLKKFKDIDVRIEVVDEWVLIFIDKHKEKTEKFKYTFIKDINGSGFSESFNTMEELISKYGDWIDVDWDEIIKKTEEIKHFPNNTFTEWHDSHRILIKKASEEGNKWGYNFYIKKSMKID